MSGGCGYVSPFPTSFETVYEPRPPHKRRVHRLPCWMMDLRGEPVLGDMPCAGPSLCRECIREATWSAGQVRGVVV
jgi:hypothetical protein